MRKWPSRSLPLFLLLMTTLGALPALAGQDAPIAAARHIPIQHNGRIKPLDSFARQLVRFVTGSERWEKKDAIITLLDLLADREKIGETRWIRVDYPELKEKLGLSENERFFSMNEVVPSVRKIQTLVRDAKLKRDRDERPTKLEQKAEELYSKMHAVDALGSGSSINVLPAPFSSAWGSPYEIKAGFSPEFIQLVQDYKKRDWARFEKGTKDWIKKVYAVAKETPRWKLALEVQYYRFQPFEAAAIAYFAAFLLLTFFKRKRPLVRAGLFFLGAAVVGHTAGIVFRVLILSRPPVSNMYESMIFMNWALIVFALGFSVLKRNPVPLVVGSAVSGFVMIYGNLLPLDSGLEVLVPVLRSNYWLTIHVMTVVSSYGAFGLAMGLGHRHLFHHAFRKFSKSAEEESANLIFKVIQLGTLLIGTGTVLGGVWANESWGRFWGWDPKETWALITFLGYLIVVHLRYAKKLSDFGLALFSVLGFLLVLMTWYGVNFVLGRGLHSYGRGTGGMSWVIYYLIFEALFLGFIFLKKLKT